MWQEGVRRTVSQQACQDGGRTGEGAARPVVTGGADRPVYRRRVVDRGQCRETSRDTVREGGLSTERHGSRR